MSVNLWMGLQRRIETDQFGQDFALPLWRIGGKGQIPIRQGQEGAIIPPLVVFRAVMQPEKNISERGTQLACRDVSFPPLVNSLQCFIEALPRAGWNFGIHIWSK